MILYDFDLIPQFIVHVSGWTSDDLTLTIPITIGSVPYQPPHLPTPVEPSAPPLEPPPYSDEISPYPGVGKLCQENSFILIRTDLLFLCAWFLATGSVTS